MSTLYEELASRLERQVKEGLYRPGDRLPSIRRLAGQEQVSIATVESALALLEDRRIVEARYKSGYYVRAASVPPDPPRMQKLDPGPVPVSIGRLAMRMYADSLREDGLVNLGGASIPSPDFPAVGQIKRLLARHARQYKGSGYVSPVGVEELRLAIARRLANDGVAVSVDDIVITAGCQEALGLSLRAVAKPGDIVAVESPTYFGILQLIQALGMQALEIPSDPNGGISLPALRLALEKWPVAACVVIPSYSNPTGACMPEPSRQALCELAAEYSMPVIEDDIYGELGYMEPRARPVKRWDQQGQVLLCSSLSKSVSPILRIGWVAAGRFREQIAHLKLLNSICVDPISQLAVAEFFSGGALDRHLRQVRMTYRQRRDQVVELVRAHFPPGTRMSYPQGGYFAWLDLPRPVDTLALYDQAIAEGIVISPGPLFSATGKYTNAMRINFARELTQDAERAFRRLASLVTQAAGYPPSVNRP